MKKVDLSAWGGTKVRNRMKVVWDKTGQPTATADAEFGTYQQSLATTVANANELIDRVQHVEGVLARRPF